MRLDSVDQRLLGMLQAKLPLTVKPYADLGLSLDIPEGEVIRRIDQMKIKGLVRQIGPVLDAVRLGYKTTLVAMRVAEAHLDRAARLLAEHRGVSHVYERAHRFNLWFTMAMPDTADIGAEILRLADMIEAEAAFDLPAIRVFKLRTYFNSDADDKPEISTGITDNIDKGEACLSPEERDVINQIQQDLPLIPRPFAEMSAHLGMDQEVFVTQCRSLLSHGIIRRFSASVNHRRAGFTANAMICWATPPEKVEVITEKLVPLRQVSHCYERKTNSEWHYNIFAMIHGHSRAQCQEIADKITADTGLTNYVLLLSTREFKKTRVIYQV